MMMLLERSKHDEDGVARVYGPGAALLFCVDLEKDFFTFAFVCPF